LPVFAVITLAVYCKTLTGKVPFPHEIILHFAPWAGLNHAITNQPYASIGDLATQMYPFRAFAARSVRSGNLPLWNPYLLSGTPFLGNSQSAMFYPPNALAYVFTLGFVSRDVLRSVNSAGIDIPESAAYIAMIAFVAAPLAALHSAKRYAGILFFLSLAAFMVAFGLNPAHWLAVHTPFLQSIKNWRLLLVVDFCLAGLTGLGISAVEEGEFGDKRKLAALIFTTAGFLVAFALVYALQRHTGFRVEFLRRPSFSRGLLLMCFALVILRIFNYMPRRAFAVTICAVATFDAVTFAYGYTGFAPPQDIFPPAPVFEFLQRTVQPGRFRVADFGDVYPANSNLMYGTPSVDGYDLPLRRLRLFTKGMRPQSQTGVFLDQQAVEANDRRLDLLNVKYIVVSKFDAAYRSIERQSRFSAVLQGWGPECVRKQCRTSASICGARQRYRDRTRSPSPVRSID